MVFQGEFDQSVDDKGRVIIPTRFRTSLGVRFYMTKGIGGCIFIYTEGAYNALSETLQQQRQLGEHTIRLQRFFTSTEASVDGQGRVIIPTRFRSSLGVRFYMTKGIGGCIFVYTESAYNALSETLQQQRQWNEHTLRLQRFFTSTEAQADGQGRVTIPAKLREWAKIEEQGDVVVVGTGSRIEIWSRAGWDRYNDELTDAMITESAREVGIA